MQPDEFSASPSKPVLSKARGSKARGSKTRKRLALFGIGAGAVWSLFLGFGLPRLLPELPPPKTAQAPTPQAQEPEYRTYTLDNATVHVVKLSTDMRPSIAVADELTTVRDFAQQSGAIAVLNAGFFDPQNGKTTSYLVSAAQVAGDPVENERLVGNPDLEPYMARILNRSEFRVYDCGTNGYQYDIVLHNTTVPTKCAIESAVGAGPQLLPEDTSFEEGFTDFENGELTRDAIGSRGANARSAIALTADNAVLLIMVAQRPDAPGLTLLEVADFAASIGATKLLNLDGGSSSSLYYGQTYLGRLDSEDNPIERPVKSVILVRPSAGAAIDAE